MTEDEAREFMKLSPGRRLLWLVWRERYFWVFLVLGFVVGRYL